MKEQILSKLKEEGWNIREEFFESISEKPVNFHSTLNFLANTDFKDCGAPSLPNDIGKNKNTSIQTPVVLQVTNVRNVSAPKANEGSATAPRMLRLTLTDGFHYIHGLEINFIKSLSLKTPPGTKIKLYSKIPVVDRYLLLSPSNTELIGGVVEELYQKWKLSESVSKYSRSGVLNCDGTGPPPWVPFGKKITVEKEKNFKAMEDSAAKKKENDDFEHQRQQVVMELTKESSQKVFGGGKQMLDSNVQKIINSGNFTISEAEWALKRNKNDLKKALQDLRRNQSSGSDATRGTPVYEDRGRGRGGKRGRGRGKGKDNRGPDGSDDELPHSAVFRPSGPASLLDYLESRISEKVGGEPEPRNKTEKQEDIKYYPRGGRDYSRGSRGRGRGGYINKQFGNDAPKSEPAFSVENWPSLGQEKAAEEEKKNCVNPDTSSHREESASSSHDNVNKFEVQSSYNKKKHEGISQPTHTNSSNSRNYQYQNNYNSHQSYVGNNSSINSNNSEIPQSHHRQNMSGDNRQQFYNSDSYKYDDTRKEPQRKRS
ncbi:Tudor domain-containing protein 3 [Armadillidium vulgare]|nr:Tudor domain-containing protein 3 [Armadillidium vulgare]